MWIEKLYVENFKLFEKRNFSFHPQFNLIVGENGSGKTSSMDLLATCISAWIQDIDSMEYIRDYFFPKNVIRTEVFDYEGELRNSYSGYILIETEWQDVPVISGEPKIFKSIIKYKSDNNDAIVSGYETNHGSRQFRDFIVNRHDFIMPLFVFYPCNRFWKPSVSENTIQKAMEAQYSRRSGYYDWDHAKHDASEFMLWIQKLDIISYQEKSEPLGWRLFQHALKICLEGFERLHFMAKEGQPVILFDGMRRIPFKQLSDGQRTIFALIGDLVRRAVLLNPQLGDKVLEETPGVVLIDELDLHLHPKWQRRIIEDLRRTFPKIQFIATTHSPFLIQSLREGKLIQLDGETGEEYSDASLEDIAENIQGIEMPQKSLRFRQMMEAAEAYYKHLHECADETDPQTQSLKQRLDELSIPFSDDPAFAAFLKFERDTLIAKEEKEG